MKIAILILLTIPTIAQRLSGNNDSPPQLRNSLRVEKEHYDGEIEDIRDDDQMDRSEMKQDVGEIKAGANGISNDDEEEVAPTVPSIMLGKAHCDMEQCKQTCESAGGQGTTIGGFLTTAYNKEYGHVMCTTFDRKTGTNGEKLTGCLVYSKNSKHSERAGDMYSTKGHYIDAICGVPKKGAGGLLINSLKGKSHEGSSITLTCIPCPGEDTLEDCKFRLDGFYKRYGFETFIDENEQMKQQDESMLENNWDTKMLWTKEKDVSV